MENLQSLTGSDNLRQNWSDLKWGNLWMSNCFRPCIIPGFQQKSFDLGRVLKRGLYPLIDWKETLINTACNVSICFDEFGWTSKNSNLEFCLIALPTLKGGWNLFLLKNWGSTCRRKQTSISSTLQRFLLISGKQLVERDNRNFNYYKTMCNLFVSRTATVMKVWGHAAEKEHLCTIASSLRPRAMACCSATSLTPLAQFARSLRTLDDNEKLPMFFPMYTVPSGMIEPHEALKARDDGRVQKEYGQCGIRFTPVGCQQPPWPRVQADECFAGCSEGNDGQLEECTRGYSFWGAKSKFEALAHIEDSLGTWNRSSCGMIISLAHRRNGSGHGKKVPQSKLLDAINSIPAYADECSFFFALVPVLENRSETNLITPFTWNSRGWCRLERSCRELSQNQSWIQVKGPNDLLLILGAIASIRAGSGPVGEGAFAVPEDRLKLGPVLMKAVKRKLLWLLKAQDLPGFRFLLNQQAFGFRGLDCNLFKPVPGFWEQPCGFECFSPCREVLLPEWFPQHLWDGQCWIFTPSLCGPERRPITDSRPTGTSGRSEPSHKERALRSWIWIRDFTSCYLLHLQEQWGYQCFDLCQRQGHQPCDQQQTSSVCSGSEQCRGRPDSPDCSVLAWAEWYGRHSIKMCCWLWGHWSHGRAPQTRQHQFPGCHLRVLHCSIPHWKCRDGAQTGWNDGRYQCSDWWIFQAAISHASYIHL